MKKSFNPLKNLHLDPYEQEIEDALERGDFVEVPLTAKIKKEYADAAKYTLALEKKDARLNIRMKHSDLRAIRSKATANGLPYQTLIATLLHHFAIGKVNIRL